MAYVEMPITSDTDSLKQAGLDFLTANGWNPEDGDPEVISASR